MIVLDTNILIWLIDSPEKVSPRARLEINKFKKEGQICVSTFSIWEIALLVKKKRLKFDIGVEEWIDKLKRLSFIKFIDVTAEIAYKSVYLPGRFHKDPADRVIVTTAISLGADLITSDKKILEYKHVQSIW